MARARHNQMRAAAQPDRKLGDSRGRDDSVHSCGDDEDRLPDPSRIAGLGQLRHDAKGGIAPGDRRRTDRQRRLRLDDGDIAGVAHRVGAEQVAFEWTLDDGRRTAARDVERAEADLAQLFTESRVCAVPMLSLQREQWGYQNVSLVPLMAGLDFLM